MAISGVDITELYSLVRVAAVATRFGLTPGTSFDLTNGWDMNRDDHKRHAWAKVKEEAPVLLIGSPLCTYYFVLQAVNKAVHGNKPGWQERFDIETNTAIKHVEFCYALYKYQIQ